MKKPLVQTTPLVTRINVTPIIDVALVLVIILLITAPMMSVAEVELELPTAHTREDERTDHLTITVGRDGTIALGEDVLTGSTTLTSAVRTRLAADPGQARLVVVRADAGLPHALVRDVMSQARAGGATRLGLATRQGEDR